MSVIFIVADGTGFAHYSVLFQEPKGRKIFKEFEHCLLVNTCPASSKRTKSKCLSTRNLTPVTESASSATAMSTGKWVPHRAVASNGNGRRLQTVPELARERKRMNFGAICTTEFFDATPAAFFAHSDDRDNYQSLSCQILNFGLDVLVSGGNMISDLLQTERHRLPEYSKLISKTQYVGKNRSVKSVANHLNKVLNVLKHPFFLLVEESLIDVASHDNKTNKMACELTSLMHTVQTALNYVKNDMNKTTLILISDHSTGAAVVDNIADDSSSHFRFNSGFHNGHIVPLFISGYRSAQVINFVDTALIDMIDVYDILIFLLRL